MTVQELIDELNKVKDKEKKIIFDVNMKTYVGSLIECEDFLYVTNLQRMKD